MSHPHQAVLQAAKMLKQLDGWLEKAVVHARSLSFDPEVLLEARLAPDMFPLRRQIQGSCDGVKYLAGRLAGKEVPRHEDGPQTIPQLRDRIRAVLEYAAGFQASDFDKADRQVVPLPFLPGKGLAGSDYLHEMNVPNTYFHMVIAYAILRHNGVPLGKVDYLGSLNLRDL